jgi:hypothetical protein
MIFWDPITGRMNVSVDYKLDPMGSLPNHFPSVCYDGQISPLVLRGGKNSTKEPFPPGSRVTVNHEGEFCKGNIESVPIASHEEYVVVFDDSPQLYSVPLTTIVGEGEPHFHMASMDPDTPVTAGPPTVPEWIKEDTHVTTDQGWTFAQRTSSGRTTYTLDLSDLPVTWEDRITEGSLELGWQASVRAYHVSAKGMSEGIPRSFHHSMSKECLDRKIWIESYLEEVEGLKEQDTYIVINDKEHRTNYPDVQVIPSMSVRTVKQDDRGDPVRAKTQVVALGNFEETVWEKSEKYAPVLVRSVVRRDCQS